MSTVKPNIATDRHTMVWKGEDGSFHILELTDGLYWGNDPDAAWKRLEEWRNEQ